MFYIIFITNDQNRDKYIMTINSFLQPFLTHEMNPISGKVNDLHAEKKTAIIEQQELTHKIIEIANIFEAIRTHLKCDFDSFYAPISQIQYMKDTFISPDGKFLPNADKIASLKISDADSVYTIFHGQLENYFDLIITKNIDESIEVANLLSKTFEKEKSSILHSICFKCLTEGEINRSINLIQGIKDERIKSIALSDIIDTLKVNNLNEAITLAKEIPDFKIRKIILDDLYDSASDLADSNKKLSALSNICKALIEINEIIPAISIVKNIPDYKMRIQCFTMFEQEANKMRNLDQRSSALSNICMALIEINEIIPAISVAKKIPDYKMKIQSFTMFEEEANKMMDLDQRSFALSNICKALIEINEIIPAISIAKKIPDVEMRIESFSALQENANRIAGLYKRSFILLKICKALTGIRDVDRAVSVAETIPNNEIKTHAMETIYESLTEVQKFFNENP